MPRLTLAQANRIVEAPLAKGREMKIKPLAVAILDDAGHVKSLQREDAVSMFRNDIAIGKAWAQPARAAERATRTRPLALPASKWRGWSWAEAPTPPVRS